MTYLNAGNSAPQEGRPPGPPPGVYGPQVTGSPPPSGQPGAWLTSRDLSWATMAQVGAIFFPIFAPIAVLLLNKGRPFPRHHARQALNLGITTTIYSAICGAGFKAAPPGGVLQDVFGILLLVVTVGILVHLISAAMSARRGVWHRHPTWITWPLLK
jgi:uncharacterized Tic20 family protein